jgi:hypothetical protein
MDPADSLYFVLAVEQRRYVAQKVWASPSWIQ